MGFSDKQFRRIKCDAPGCDKDVEFDLKDIPAIQAIEWLKGVRVVQTGDNRSFAYCSDVCEVKAITTGVHNLKEVSKVALATEADAKAAAAQAQAASDTDKALKTGEGQAQVTLT